MKIKKAIALCLGAISAITLTACSDAMVADHNLSWDADNFKIPRRVVFINGITDKYLLSVEGYCNINDQEHQLETVCKVGEGEYKKHFLGRSNNVTYVVEQLDPAKVSTGHYKLVFKPSTIVPELEIR